MALLRTFELSHTILRCPLHCILAGTKSLKICFICLCSVTLTCEYEHISANQGCLWCSCSHAEWELLIKAAACVETHSLLFSSYAAWHPWSPSELLQPTPEQEFAIQTDGCDCRQPRDHVSFFHDVWVLTAFPDIIPNGCQFRASCLKGICQH